MQFATTLASASAQICYYTPHIVSILEIVDQPGGIELPIFVIGFEAASGSPVWVSDTSLVKVPDFGHRAFACSLDDLAAVSVCVRTQRSFCGVIAKTKRSCA